MKKLVIAVAVVCTAVFAQAAAVDWSTGDLYGSNGEYISDNLSAGYTYTAVMTIAALGDSAGTMNWDAFEGTFSNAELSTTYTGTLLITEFKDGVAINSISAEASFTTKASASFNTALDWGSGSGFTSFAGINGGSGNWSAVPEPTSGLLMLLGMAGLALKRKRA